jgi:YebC/PmpR family DNA-binding regulatory protein
MSGHSKWHSIKHKKALVDAKRGKMFSRIVREITVAAKIGGGDPDANPRLRTAMQAARDVNMPSKNIENAIAKGSGAIEGAAYEEITFEGYGPGGAAFIVECSTDNRNRAAADVRHAFNKYNGNLGETGCVSYMFDRKGEIIVEAEASAEDELMMVVVDAGGEDIKRDDEGFRVYTAPRPDIMFKVREAIEGAGYKVEKSEITRVPNVITAVEGKEAQSCLKLYDMLENLDDTQNLYTNFDVSEEDVEAYEKNQK